MKTFVLFVLFIGVYIGHLDAQVWELHINVNEIYPTQNKELGYYPILWYSSLTEDVLVGGFGAGISMSKILKPRVELLSHLNVQRSRFRDNPVIFQDPNGSRLGNFSGINTSYSANFFMLPNLKITKGERLAFGLGLGVRAVLSSKTNYGEAVINGETRSLNYSRRSAARLIGYLPLRIRYDLGAILLETGFDYDISNASRLDGVKERYFTLQSGIAFKLNRSKK